MKPHISLAIALLAASCSFPEHLTYASLQSPAMGREMDYAVYTPPGWTETESLPLVVFLHGGGDDEDCFDRAGMAPVLDAAIEAGEMPRVVVCVPNGEKGFWENWHDGSYRYRDWVMDDLIPHVRERYHTGRTRADTHLLGISMGGHGALRFARLEGESFASVGAISAPVMNAEQLVAFTDSFWVRMFVPVERIWGPTDDIERVRQDDLFELWQEPADLGGIRLMVVHGDGDRDGIIKGSRAFHEHLTARGIDHGYLVYEGGHKWVAWKPVLPGIIRHLVAGG